MIVGIGTDIVGVKRIAEAAENPKFLERILTPDERALNLSPLRIAGRWAAKEAIYKAIGGGVSWQDMSIVNAASGKPEVVWHKLSPVLEDCTLHLSISHEEDYASAVAVLEQPGPNPPPRYREA